MYTYKIFWQHTQHFEVAKYRLDPKIVSIGLVSVINYETFFFLYKWRQEPSNLPRVSDCNFYSIRLYKFNVQKLWKSFILVLSDAFNGFRLSNGDWHCYRVSSNSLHSVGRFSNLTIAWVKALCILPKLEQLVKYTYCILLSWLRT